MNFTRKRIDDEFPEDSERSIVLATSNEVVMSDNPPLPTLNPYARIQMPSEWSIPVRTTFSSASPSRLRWIAASPQRPLPSKGKEQALPPGVSQEHFKATVQEAESAMKETQSKQQQKEKVLAETREEVREVLPEEANMAAASHHTGTQAREVVHQVANLLQEQRNLDSEDVAALLTALQAEIQMATSGTHEAIQKLSENMATDRNFVAQWMKEVGNVVK